MLAVPGLIEIAEDGGLDSATRNWVISLHRSSSAMCRNTRAQPLGGVANRLYGVGIVRVEPVLTFLRFPSRRLHSHSQPRGDKCNHDLSPTIDCALLLALAAA